MNLKQRAIRFIDACVCLARKIWRPLSCLGLVGSVWVNMVVIPWRTQKPIDFASAATFTGAIVAAFAVREIGKIKGSAD